MPIFDQGYQHWSGALAGHTWRWLTITRQGVRSGMKTVGSMPVLFFRLFIIGSWFPAAFLAFLLCAWGLLEQKSPLVDSVRPLLSAFFPREVMANPKTYRAEVWTLCFQYFLNFQLYISMIVVLLVGSSLISQDLRFNALPLYFSRPLRRIDYFVGKLGIIATFLGMVLVVPVLIAYVLGLLFSLDVTIIWDTWIVLVASLEYGVVIIVSAGTLMLALSSLSRNSRYIALFWVGLWFVTGVTSTILDTLITEQRHMDQRMRLIQVQYPAQQGAPVFEPGRQRPFTPEEAEETRRAKAEVEEKIKKLHQDIKEEERRAVESNWRPLLSYTANLARIGQWLSGRDDALKKLAPVYAPDGPDEWLAEHQGPQYPWYWSACVLAVLFGISLWILHVRVRSLDRLK